MFTRARVEDVTITDVTIKTPDRKYDRGCECDGLRILEFEKKKQLVEIWT